MAPESTRRPLITDLEGETLHTVWASETVLAVGGDLSRGTHGVLVGEGPSPLTGLHVPSDLDAGRGDDGALDTGPDVNAVDAADPDGNVRDAGSVDTGPLDATTELDARGPEPDVPVPDVPVPDARVVDVAVADVALPGPAQDCPDFRCTFPLECWELAVADWRPVCTESCREPADCEGYGRNPCCVAPGPQVAATYCIARAALPDNCGLN